MQTRNMILSGALLSVLIAIVTLSSLQIALAVGVGFNETPNTGLSIYTIKKAALICDHGASAPTDQFFPEYGGCVDVLAQDQSLLGNATDARFNEYLFGGEQLAELVVARDLSGAQFLSSTANLMVDGKSVTTCTPVDPASLQVETGGTCTGTGTGNCAALTTKTGCQSYSASPYNCVWNPTYATMWYGHDISGLLGTLPPKQGTSDTTGFNPAFDKLYSCLATVDPSWHGSPSKVNVQVSDVSLATAPTEVQEWFFNPAISILVSFDSGSGIQFPPAQAGQTVYSTNTLLIKNTAAGGVDLAVYLAGNDLQDTSGIGLCPTSRILSATNIGYRCKVGTYMSEVFTPLQDLNEKTACDSLVDRQCLVDGPTASGNSGVNDLLPDATSEFTSILYNGHTAECWFQLNVPMPCIGSYSSDKAVDVLVRAI